MTRVRFHRAVVSLFLGAASVSAGAACSGGHEDVVLPQAPTEVDAAYGIRAYGTFGGETKVLTFGGPTKTTGTLGTLAEPRSSATLDGLRSYDLLRMAASECGLGGRTGKRPTAYRRASHRAYGPATEGDIDLSGTAPPGVPSLTPVVVQTEATPVPTPGFSIFAAEAATCDQQIDQEEVLLCAAERLASLADSEVPVTWANALPGVTGKRGFATIADIGPGIDLSVQEGDLPIIFPVLDPKTKFLARDLALQALSSIPLLDARTRLISGQTYTCSALYAAAPALPAGTPRNAGYTTLYNTSTAPASADFAKYYPPIDVWPPTNKRLDQLTQVLRASAQLTKQLIEQSVDGDLAAAADKIAALSSEERMRALWLAPDDSFNSMAHAARVLYGRQATLGFPEDSGLRAGCATVPSTSSWLAPDVVWKYYAPPSLSARGSDRILRTKQDLVAERLVAASGLFTSPAAPVAAALQRSELRSAVASLAPNSRQAARLGEQIDLLPDGALSTAFARQTALLGVTGNVDPSASVIDLQKGIEGIGRTATVSGSFLRMSQGLSRTAPVADSAAALGGVQVASYCAERSGSSAILGDAPLPSSALAGTDNLWHPRQLAFATQDAFAVAQQLRARALALRSVAPSTGVGADARDGMIAELDTWAGGLRVIAEPKSGTSLDLHLYDIDLASFKSSAPAADFVLVSASDLRDAPFAAAVAAGTVPAPKSPVGNVYTATSATLSATNDPAHGLLRQHWTLRFDALPTADQTYYVVRRGSSGSASGMVLGALSGNLASTKLTSFGFSPFRRELVDRAFAFPKDTSTLGASMGDTRDMCIPGVPRDLYVPMESETTSDGDAYESSWRHYMTLARQAAEKADGLGRDLVQIGSEKDTRKEGYASQILDSTGVAMNADCLTTTNGVVDASKCPAPLEAFLSERRFDVVFVTSNPIPTGLTNENARAALKTVLGCTNNVLTDPASCARLDSESIPRYVAPLELGKTTPAEHEFLYTSLGLLGAPNPKQSTADECEAVAEASLLPPGSPPPSPPPGAPTPPSLEKALQTEILRDDDRVFGAIDGLRVEVGVDGEFVATIAGDVIVDSHVTRRNPETGGQVPSAIWPGCARGAGNCQWDPAGITERGRLNQLVAATLYRCSPSTPLNACLGATEEQGLAAIRWDLLGQAYMAHAIAGRSPEGAFLAPVPAARFSDNVLGESGTCSLIVSALGTGRWGPGLAPAYSVWAGSMSAQETAVLTRDGAVVEVAPTFGMLPSNAAATMPSWYRSIYAPELLSTDCWKKSPWVDYVHIPAKSTALSWSDYDAHPADKAHSLDSALAMETGVAGGVGPGVNAFGRRAIAGWRSDFNPVHEFLSVLKARLVQNKYGRRIEANSGLQGRMGELFTSNNSTRIKPGYFRRFHSGNRNITELWTLDSTPVDYHWTDHDGVSLDDYYTTDRTFPCNSSGDDSDMFGKCMGKISERLPSVQSPAERVQFFVNSGYLDTPEEGRRQFRGALALACIGTMGKPLTDLPEAPAVTGMSDVTALEGWIRSRRKATATVLSRLFAEDVPAVAVQSFLSRSTGGTALGGRAGEANLAVRGALQRTADGLRQSVTNIDDLQRALAILKADIGAKDAAADVKNASRRVADWQAVRGAVTGIAGGIGGVLGPSPSAAGLVSSLADAAGAGLVQGAIADLRDKEDAADDADRRTIFARFSQEAGRLTDQQTQTLSNTRQAAIDLQAALVRLKSERGKTLDVAARASGAGAWVCATDGATNKPIECTSPVNTVLNRRFAATKIRYEQALRDARTLAYIARRAIEQRFGQRLDQLSTPIGPLEAPSGWADSVCSLQGVDYDALRKESILGANGKKLTDPELAAWNDSEAQRLAKSNVTDYVDRLQRFVDYYPIAFPSHDGDDTTMISLREDALRNQSACQSVSTNLLASSDALADARSPVGGAVGTWATHRCPVGQAFCARVSKQAPVAGVGGAAALTWLRNEARFTEGPPEAGIDAPGNYVSQAVLLEPGSYVLSFYAASLDAAGAAATTSSVYRAVALDEAGNTVATGLYDAEAGTTTTGGGTSVSLSQRRTLAITVANRGLYRIGFAPSAQPGGVGSIGLVQPQLQRDERAEGPTAYEPTDSERMTPSSDCPSTPAQLRGNFTRKCADNRCFYELNTPISIDSAAFTVNGNPLQNKLAAANFNYRHIDIAVNLVGTGLRSCDANPTPACYASGTVDYDLLHEANGIGIVAYDAAPRVFDFGTGRISSGKALATERYLTLPLSGADASLVSQQGVLKTELRGRPIDGRYTLRVYDNPALRWEKLEDIQLLLHTRYWSRVDSPSSF